MIHGPVEKHNSGTGYNERLRVGWEFADHHLLKAGQTLSGTPTVVVSADDGSQDGALTIESGATGPAISGTQVLCWINGGTVGQTYVLKCLVTLSGGATLSEALSVVVKRY